LSREGRSVGELLADLPKMVSTPELRVDCPDELKFSVVEAVRDKLRGQGELSEIDGARLTYADGSWALVRASNTGPVIVLRFEAPNAVRLEQVRREIESLVNETRGGLEGHAR
jgi:phosphomannomutase/phosphoglucomutase